jgi:peptide deformylase
MEKMLENYELEGQLLEILTYPSPILTKVAEPVTQFDAELKELCMNMIYTMYDAPGIGLAAPQIGIGKRIFVVDVNYSKEEVSEDSEEYTLENLAPMIFINPVLKDFEGEIIYQEGCLSLPDIYEDVKRYENLNIEYQDSDGNPQSLAASELLSICLQHENDHLDGIVFLDRLSLIKKKFLKKKLIKAKND